MRFAIMSLLGVVAAGLLRDGRPGLSLDEARPAAAIASFEIAMFQELGLDWDSKRQRDAARETLSRLNRAPRHGRLRIPFWLEVVPREGAAGWRLRLRSQTKLDDLVAEAFALVPAAP
jgi:hypothetical protein